MVVNSRSVARIKFSVSGQESTPQLATIHSAIRYSALEEWKSRIILLTLRYENKDTAYKPINSTLH